MNSLSRRKDALRSRPPQAAGLFESTRGRGGGGALPVLTSAVSAAPRPSARQLLDSNAFNPEEVTILRDVFEDTLRALKLTDRSDPITSLIAKKIIELARLGERDPARLRQAAVQAFSIAPGYSETPPN